MRLFELDNPKLKMPRIKKLDSRGRISVYLVNADWVRNKLDHDYDGTGLSMEWKFIPENEIWIDNTTPETDIPFLMEELLIEHRLLSRGIKLQFASDTGKQAVKALKHKIAGGQMTDQFGGNPNKVHIRRWLSLGQPFGKGVDTPLEVWIVDGKLIRELFDNTFFESANDLSNSYVPKNEIWIDADVVAPDRPFVLLHQLYERHFLEKGDSMIESYKKACRLESRIRQVPENLAGELAKFKIDIKDMNK